MEADQARQLAAREATAWLIALQEEPDDPALRRRFEAWRAGSALNEAAWLATERALGMAESLPPRHIDKWQAFVASRRPGQKAPGSVVGNRPERRGRRLARRRWTIAACGMAAAAVLAFIAVPAVLVRLQADFVTSTAELREIELEDGSVVTLSAGSAIAVHAGTHERQVTLVQGEAFFQVKPDAMRPFRVVAGSVRTTVVGTSFDVRRDSNGVTVAVEQGIVQVELAEPEVKERLEAGESVHVDRKGKVARAADKVPVAAGWRQGQLLAQNQSLEDAVDQLRRYYDGSIIVTDDALGARRITGVYNLSDPEEALRGIARAHGAKVRRLTPWLLVVSPE